MRRVAVGAAVFAVVLVWSNGPAGTQPRSGGSLSLVQVDGYEAVANEVLVALRPGAPGRAWSEIAAAGGADELRPLGRAGARRLRSRSLGTSALRARLMAHPHVRYAEPNWVVNLLAPPTDPLAPQLWGLLNLGQAVNGGLPGRPGADINAAGAWDLSVGSTSHVVAIVDTGIDYTHPDLAPNLWSAPAAFSVTVGGRTVTCPAGTHGFDAMTLSCDPMDDHNHGTHVAGTIGAAGGNGLGVAGVNWTARLMGLRFIGASGKGTTADAITALEFAMQARGVFGAAANVRVLSNSWGTRTYSQALADTIAATAQEDMLFVASAGNDGFSNDILPMYPASYPLPNVVAVAATTNTDDRAWFSNYGAASVHLGAPGVDILSTVRGHTYVFASGTSMAAPHVSGAAALVLSRCALDTPALRDTLLDTAERLPSLAPWTMTGARLDVHGAVRSCIGPPDAPANLTASAADRRVDLAWSQAPGATAYTVRRGQSPGGPYATLASDLTQTTFTDAAVANETTYFYVVAASNALGQSADSEEVSATPKAPSDLTISALTVPTAAGAGTPLAISASTRNQGLGTSNETTTRFFLSANAVRDASDVELTPHQAVPPLAPSATATTTPALTIPPAAATGTYYLVAVADADSVETETSEWNNQAARMVRVGPDLAISTLTAPTMAGAGASVLVTDTVRNQGGGASGESVTRFYLSANSLLDASDVLLAGTRAVAPLAAGATATGSASVMIPASTPAGSYFLIAKADGGEAVAETLEGNNTFPRSLQVGGDLVVSGLTVPLTGGAGTSIAVTDTTRNQGAGAVAASTTRFYLSSNATYDAGDTLLPGGRAVPALGAGAVSSGTTSVTLPAGLSTGSYFILARADAEEVVAETQEGNNTTARSIAVGPDLWISNLSVPYSNPAGAVVTIMHAVKNQGAGGAGASTTRFYLSANVTLDAADVQLDGSAAIPPLAAGSQQATSSAVTIPAGTPAGTYYFYAKADADGAVVESQEGNNVSWRVVQVTAGQ